MELALKMAKAAYHEDEVPVGAVMVGQRINWDYIQRVKVIGEHCKKKRDINMIVVCQA